MHLFGQEINRLLFTHTHWTITTTTYLRTCARHHHHINTNDLRFLSRQTSILGCTTKQRVRENRLPSNSSHNLTLDRDRSEKVDESGEVCVIVTQKYGSHVRRIIVIKTSSILSSISAFYGVFKWLSVYENTLTDKELNFVKLMRLKRL